MAVCGSHLVLSLLFLTALLCSSALAKDASEKPAKKKGDMTAYQKRIAAKFISETAKKEGVSATVSSQGNAPCLMFIPCYSFPRHLRVAIRNAC
jgi:hypothetical protein